MCARAAGMNGALLAEAGAGAAGQLIATLLLYGLAFWLVPRGAARTA